MDQESHHDHHAKQGSLVSLAFGYPDAFSTHPGIQSFSSGNDLIPGMEMLGIPSKHPQNPDTWRDFFPSVGTSSATSDGFMVAPWQHDQHPPQGLSLALCNPLSPISRHGLFSESSNYNLDCRFFPPPPASTPSMGGVYMQEAQVLQSSRYLVPAQELLNEFCSLGGRTSSSSKHHKGHLPKKWEDGGSSSSWNQSLNSLDLMDLEKRKAKLLSMLEELERRYMKYREQMRAVVSSFEAMAGEGAAAVYSTLASKAMSRHFRSLRDGIVGQLNVTKKAMGDKEIGAQGTMRGETPRLRLLDQCLRQQKAVHQAVVMENHPWRPQRGLPERSVSILRAWLFEHFLHPYPSDVDKHILARQTGLSRGQVSNWFINARVRLWKPMVEEIYLEETKEQDNQSPHASVDDDNNSRLSQLHANPNPNPNPSFSQLQVQDQKPAPGSLSSIISFRDGHQNFNATELEFSTFDNSGNRNFGGSGVSLTLGLQQNYRGGMNMSFSREDVEDCQEENLPYRNLIRAQVMHDLAG